MRMDNVRKIAAIIRTVAPEFASKSDEELRVWIELSEPCISESRFGRLYPQALAYLTAHKMSLNAPAETSSEETGVHISAKDAMNVASYSEGSTSISFNNSAVSGGASGSAGDAEYLLTAYGLQFQAICKQCIVPIMIASMKRT